MKYTFVSCDSSNLECKHHSDLAIIHCCGQNGSFESGSGL